MFWTSNVHHQEDHLYMQFYMVFFMRLFKQSSRWKDVLDADDDGLFQCACLVSVWEDGKHQHHVRVTEFQAAFLLNGLSLLHQLTLSCVGGQLWLWTHTWTYTHEHANTPKIVQMKCHVLKHNSRTKYEKVITRDEAYKMLNWNLNFELCCWGIVVMCCCKGRSLRRYCTCSSFEGVWGE